MKKLLFATTLALGLTACGLNGPADRSYTKDLGAVTIRVEADRTIATLDEGYLYAKIEWTSDVVNGGDNIYRSVNGGRDIIGLGYKQNISVRVVEFK